MNLVAVVFNALADDCRVVEVVGHPRQMRTASVHENVLASGMAVIVAENQRAPANCHLYILHQALRVIDRWMAFRTRTKPSAIQIFTDKRASVANIHDK